VNDGLVRTIAETGAIRKRFLSGSDYSVEAMTARLGLAKDLTLIADSSARERPRYQILNSPESSIWARVGPRVVSIFSLTNILS